MVQFNGEFGRVSDALSSRIDQAVPKRSVGKLRIGLIGGSSPEVNTHRTPSSC